MCVSDRQIDPLPDQEGLPQLVLIERRRPSPQLAIGVDPVLVKAANDVEGVHKRGSGARRGEQVDGQFAGRAGSQGTVVGSVLLNWLERRPRRQSILCATQRATAAGVKGSHPLPPEALP